jgi:hypothetical protein
MDIDPNENLRGKLFGILTRVDDRLPSRDDAGLIHEFFDANEGELALEQMADLLAEGRAALRDDVRADMLALVDSMAMSDRVSRALALCPRAE